MNKTTSPLPSVKIRSLELLAPIAFVVIGVSIYGISLNAPFYFDDFNFVNYYQANFRLSELTNGLPAAFFTESRWLGNFSLALNYSLAKERTFYFHLINVFIHITATFVLYLFLKDILVRSRIIRGARGIDRETIAFFAALLFLCHPVMTQAVTYIVQRLASLAAMFYLISMWSYTRAYLTRLQPPLKYRLSDFQ